MERVTTKVTKLGTGGYGVRVFYDGKLVFENNSPKTRAEAAAALKEELRFIDKLGYDSPMASASRHRGARRQNNG